MNWSLVIYLVFLFILFIGIVILKINIKPVWTVSRRAFLRSGIRSNVKKYKSWYWFICKKKGSPVHFIFELIKNNRMQRIDREIFDAISFLRNIAAIGQGRSASTDFIIQKLLEQKGLLQPIYFKMLSLLRLNKEGEAIEVFSSYGKSAISRDFARLLIQWDKIDPNELVETLFSYEKNIKEIRFTNLKKRDEVISDLIYLPVVLNVLIIFVNFIYVAYFIEQREMLQMFL